jgi:hypothetical protein
VHEHDDFVECQIQARFYKWNHFHVIETNKLDEYASWKKYNHMIFSWILNSLT